MCNSNCQSRSRLYGCSCPHCESELKNGCMNPEFCSPCGVKMKNLKVCSVCKAQYLPEYEKCPLCQTTNL